VSGLQPSAPEVTTGIVGQGEGHHSLVVRDGEPGASASLIWALTLIDQGLPCFPCRADKRPATPRGFKDATRARKVVLEMWRRYPGPLIGIPTGEISGLDILDIDPNHGGDRWFAQHEHRLRSTRRH
jgi:Bifunctional DNA primase/polymerase, N-terminal